MLLEGCCLLLFAAASDGSCLIFPDGSPGYAQLEEITVDGDLTVSLEFRTGASEAQLLYMRETSAGHHISLSLSDGALHLKVHPDTSIGPLTEDSGEIIRLDDKQWHKVDLGFIEEIFYNLVLCNWKLISVEVSGLARRSPPQPQ